VSKNKPRVIHAQAGFTLIELTLASVLLGSMLVILTQIFINVVRQDHSVVVMQQASQNLRYALDDINTTARGATDVVIISNTSVDTGNFPSATPGSFNQVCFAVGNQVVQYFSADPRTSAYTRVLYKRTVGLTQTLSSACNTIQYPADGDVMLTTNDNPAGGSITGLSVSDFEAKTTGSVVPTVSVRLALISNLSDLTSPTSASSSTNQCKPGTATYCSITASETSISLRGATNAGQSS
jgi:prepilin-type N-terminal cleavage/methylation domain-containing protein